MPKFQDSLGREWRIGLTVAALPRLRAEAGFDLGKAAAAEKLGEMLFGDPETVAKVLWVLVDRQAEAVGVTPEAFTEGLDGLAIERAANALIEAIIDFFHRARPAAAIKSKLPEVLGKMDERLEAAMTTAMAMDATWNASAGGSPGSSGSTLPSGR